MLRTTAVSVALVAAFAWASACSSDDRDRAATGTSSADASAGGTSGGAGGPGGAGAGGGGAGGSGDDAPAFCASACESLKGAGVYYDLDACAVECGQMVSACDPEARAYIECAVDHPTFEDGAAQTCLTSYQAWQSCAGTDQCLGGATGTGYGWGHGAHKLCLGIYHGVLDCSCVPDQMAQCSCVVNDELVESCSIASETCGQCCALPPFEDVVSDGP